MSGFSINTVTISGNLTRDPEMRTVGSSGNSVCEIGIAVTERVKNQAGNWEDRPNFFDVTIWGGLGEWVGRELRKGSGIAVSGRLRWESWEKDGQKRSKVRIVADSIMPRDNGGRGESYGGGGGQQRMTSDIDSSPADFAPQTGSGGSGGYGQLGGVQPKVDDPDDIPFVSRFDSWDDLKGVCRG